MKKILLLLISFLFLFILVNDVSAQLVYNTSFENATTNSRGWYLNLDPDPHYGVPLSNYINGDGHQWIEGVESRPNAIFPSNFPGPHSGNRCLGFYYLNGSTTADRSGMALWTNPWAGTVNENPYQAQPDLTDNEFYISEWFFLPNFTLASTKDQWYGLFQYSNILGDAYPYYQFEILGHTGHASLVPANTLVAVLDWRDESGLQHYYQPYQNFQNVLPIGRWFKFEWYTLRDATNGTIKVWVDGIKIFDISGINTKHVTLPDYPEPNGEPYSIDNARIYMGTDSNPHWFFVDDIEIWNGMPGQQELAALYGKLINKTGSPIQATISAGSIENNTISDGTYSIQVPKGIYDINYSTQNLWIKLLSFNLSSDQKDLVNYITENSSENKLYFTANINGNQTIQAYSSKKPLRVLVNGTAMTEVLSYSQLTNNTWYYDSNNLYMNPISGGSGGGGCGCTNWTNQGCGLGGCASNQTYQIRTCSPAGCANTSQCVYNSSCVPACSDGTFYGQCSSNKPKYCNNGNLTDKCSVCGCPSSQTCNATSDQCYTIQACSDGTLYGQCSSNKPKYCNNGNLIDDCSLCNCLSGQSCNATTGSCYTPPQTCSDGTAYNQCSSTKPKYCNNGNLVNKCSVCGCPSNQNCNVTTDNCYISLTTCSDGTLYGQCSATKPKYCANGNLIDKCSLCSCSSGYTCLANESCNSTITADYTITGLGATASATENGGSHRTTSGATVTVINTVLGWMSAGQITDFLGTFNIGTGITFFNSNITLNFGTAPRAIVTSTAAGTFVLKYGNHVTIKGGDFSGGNDLIVAGFQSSYLTIDNVKLHDVSDEAVNFINNGYNQLINCELYNAPQTLFMGDTGYSLVSNNDFHNFGSAGSRHGIYLGSHTTITFNKFHDASGAGAAILLKGHNNIIHDNEFYNMKTNMQPPISHYSQTEGANNNEIYNNYFHNCYYGIIYGNSVDGYITTNNKVHDNTFENMTIAIYLPLNYGSYAYDSTFIYYNTFTNCKPFASSSSAPKTLVTNTVIAYNTFSATVTDLSIETFTNTMIYNNTRMADFNVPTNKTIPPP